VDARISPPIYHLSTLNKTAINFSFYRSNLTKIDENNLHHYFYPNKVLKKRKVDGKTQLLVNFKHQDPAFKRWIDKEVLKKSDVRQN
jgi:hypothetical protein